MSVTNENVSGHGQGGAAKTFERGSLCITLLSGPNDPETSLLICLTPSITGVYWPPLHGKMACSRTPQNRYFMVKNFNLKLFEREVTLEII